MDDINSPEESCDVPDDQLFRMAFIAYRRSLHQYCMTRMGLSSEDAEDTVSEVFLEVWSQKKRFENLQHLRKVLFTSAKHRCIDRERRENTQKRAHVRALLNVDVPDSSQCNESHLSYKMTRESIYDRVGTFPKKCKAVMRLYLEEAPVPVIAANLRLNEQTVYGHLNTGKEKIRRLIPTLYSLIKVKKKYPTNQ